MHPPHTVGIAWYEAGAVRHSPTVERRRYRRRAPAPGTPRAASAPPYRPAAPRRRACGTGVNRPIHADLPRVLGFPESVEQSHIILLGGLAWRLCAIAHNQTISRRPAPNTVVHPHTGPRTKSTRSYHGVNTQWSEGIMERIEELSFDGIARGVPHHGNDAPRRPRRRWPIVLAMALTTLLLACGGAWAYWMWNHHWRLVPVRVNDATFKVRVDTTLGALLADNNDFGHKPGRLSRRCSTTRITARLCSCMTAAATARRISRRCRISSTNCANRATSS